MYKFSFHAISIVALSVFEVRVVSHDVCFRYHYGSTVLSSPSLGKLMLSGIALHVHALNYVLSFNAFNVGLYS